MNSFEHLYLHFPFCQKSKCYYCSFYSIPYQSIIFDDYLKALTRELLLRQKQFSFDCISTIYIGGGSPSVDPYALRKIFQLITSSITLSKIHEITVECNPSQVCEELIEVLLESGCNRISLGIQSFNNNVTLNVGRESQNRDRVLKALDLLNSNFQNISIDLINGLPLSDYFDETKTLSFILNIFPHIRHISIYDYTVEENCLFYEKNIMTKLDEDQQGYYTSEFNRISTSFGFKKYEISNYCKQGYESFHNLGYWLYHSYLGLGPSAHSTIHGLRIENDPDINRYINGDYSKYDHLSDKDQLKEYLLMGFRLTKGINKTEYKKRFGKGIEQSIPNTLNKHLLEKNLIQDQKFIRLSKKGMNWYNSFIRDLFIEI